MLFDILLQDTAGAACLWTRNFDILTDVLNVYREEQALAGIRTTERFLGTPND